MASCDGRERGDGYGCPCWPRPGRRSPWTRRARPSRRRADGTQRATRSRRRAQLVRSHPEVGSTGVDERRGREGLPDRIPNGRSSRLAGASGPSVHLALPPSHWPDRRHYVRVQGGGRERRRHRSVVRAGGRHRRRSSCSYQSEGRLPGRSHPRDVVRSCVELVDHRRLRRPVPDCRRVLRVDGVRRWGVRGPIGDHHRPDARRALCDPDRRCQREGARPVLGLVEPNRASSAADDHAPRGGGGILPGRG